MTKALRMTAVCALCGLMLAGCVGGNQYQGRNDGINQQDDSKPNARGGRSNEGVGTGR